MKAENSTSLFESAPVADVNFEVLAKTAVKQRSWREALTDSNVVHLHTNREVDEETLNALQADQIGSSDEALPQYTPADALIRAKILSEAQVASLQSAGKRRDGFDLIQAVVEKHITSEEVVAQALVREFGYQHAYLRLPEGDPLCDSLAVGDLVGCGISHPCTTFDKWPLLLAVDDAYTVRYALNTYF